MHRLQLMWLLHTRAGFLTAICIAPLDVAKARLQVMNTRDTRALGLIGELGSNCQSGVSLLTWS